MRKHRFFVKDELAVGSKILLDEDNSHYISRVLRLEINYLIFLFNNSGYEFTATIKNIGKKQVELLITGQEADNLESPLRINLAQVIAKGEKMDLIIQKATELGVSTITPLYSERTVVRKVAERAENKSDHWQKIAIAASCQSWRNYVPTINPAIALNSWLSQPPAGTKLILSPSHSSQRIKDLQIETAVTILIGPEGGFSDEELNLAIALKFIPVCFGPRILRTETAGLAAVASLQSIFGDC